MSIVVDPPESIVADPPAVAEVTETYVYGPDGEGATRSIDIHPYHGDIEVEVDAKVINSTKYGTGTNRGINLLLRFNDAGNFYHFCLAEDTDYDLIHKNVGGVWTQLASQAHTLAVGTFYKFTCLTSGSTLKLTSEVGTISATDTAFSDGLVGIRTYGASWYARSVKKI